MYIRTKTTPNSPRKSVQIVEGIRKGNKVSQKILRHVGIAMNDDEEQKLHDLAADIMANMIKERMDTNRQMSLFELTTDQIKKSIQRKKRGRKQKKRIEDIIPTSQVSLDDVVEKERFIEGIHEIGQVVYGQLGYTNILGKGKRPNRILQDLVLARLCVPRSKRGTQKLLCSQFGKEHDLDAVYRVMDKVFANIDQIKKCTFEKMRTLFPERVNLMLFDVTTLYFESTEVDDLRNFGYSKDCRFNTTQVVLALATNEEGLPVGYELFEGNKAEVKTLVAAIDHWKTLFDIDEVCFIGDRAMFSRSNLTLLEKRGYHYVVAAKLRGLPLNMQKKILDEQNYYVTILKNQLTWLGEFDHKNRRLIVSYKSKRAEKDAKDRQRQLEKIHKIIGKKGPTKKLLNNQAIKKFTVTENSITILDEDKIAHDEQWDGMHGVITNIKDEDPSNILMRYAQLWIIEDSFRVNKHLLKMRPIFHWKPQRIHALISRYAICHSPCCDTYNIE